MHVDAQLCDQLIVLCQMAMKVQGMHKPERTVDGVVSGLLIVTSDSSGIAATDGKMASCAHQC